MIKIQIGTAPLHRFDVTLEGELITFALRYVHLSDTWQMSLYRGDVAILIGQRMTMGVDLLGSFSFGLGSLVLFAADGPGDDPGRFDFVERVGLYQLTEAERAAIQS